jgi:hypothetical protein
VERIGEPAPVVTVKPFTMRGVDWWRAGWLAAALALVLMLGASLPTLYAGLLHPRAASTRAALAWLRLGTGAFAAGNIGLGLAAALGCWLIALLLARSGANRAAPLIAFILVAFGAALPGTIYSVAAQVPIWEVPLAIPQQAIGWFALLLFTCVFPDGRFVPRWARWYLAGAAVWVTGSFLLAPRVLAARPPLLIVLGLAIWVAWFGGGVLAQGYRYLRVATPGQRQQTKWVVLGFLVAIGGSLAAVIPYMLLATTLHPALTLVLIHLAAIPLIALGALAVPISVAIAVLRHQLFDIDLIIRRTLVYGTLSAALVLIYGACVALADGVVGALGGSLAGVGPQTPGVVVVSTLAVSALFQPLRRRVQTGIDQRFYRRKYDAERTLAEFAASLRTEFDLAQFEQRLLTVVERTMQPEHVSLWLRQPAAPPHADDHTPPL